VFWNVSGNVKDFTVDISGKGIIQIAGFSKDLYQTMLELDTIQSITPESFFRKAVLSERYTAVSKIYTAWVNK
jgi:hypothetical protein